MSNINTIYIINYYKHIIQADKRCNDEGLTGVIIIAQINHVTRCDFICNFVQSAVNCVSVIIQ